MSLNLLLCSIFLWITVTDVTAKYVLTRKNITLNVAKSKENMATPEIEVDNSSFIVNLTSILNEKEEAWVGYYMKESAFAYIGCGHINNTHPDVTLPVSRNTPGLCYSKCNKSDRNYIGLNKGNCFCMNEIPSEKNHLPACNFTFNGTWMAGGGDKYMSMYERIATDISSNQDGGECLTFEYIDNKDRISWSGCNSSYFALCKKGTQFFNVHHQYSLYYTWQYYVQTCFENISLPIFYNDIISSPIVNTSGPTWSNVIRSNTIFKYEDLINSITDDHVKKYGYITKIGSIIYLSFESNVNKGRYFLQEIPTTIPTTDKSWISTTSQMSQKYTNYNVTHGTKSTKQVSVSQKTLKPEITNTLVHTTEGFKSKTDMRASGSSNVSVVVSVSVVIVVIVAAVVIIIILKRRGKIPSICVKIPVLDKSLKRTSDRFPGKNNEYVESQETDYAQIDESKANNNVDASQDLELSNGHYAHTYFVLESGTRESNTDADISDSTNDSTEINDDYNTLHETVNADTKDNGTYDTTVKAALKLKELQRAEDKEESHKMLNETEEDTYNRIDRSPLKKSKTDNIYGIPNSLENDYGDVGKTREKNLQEVDDTYNHVKLNQ